MGRQPFGEALKEARNRSGLTQEEFSTRTRIPTKYVAALENEEFTEFPGKGYLIGFLRSYCEAADLDFDEMVSAYNALDVLAAKSKPVFWGTRKSRENVIAWALIIAVLIGMWIGFTFLQKSRESEPEDLPVTREESAQFKSGETLRIPRPDERQGTNLKWRRNPVSQASR